VPRISTFYGITVWMYHDEGGHAVPHVHARYAGQFVSVGIEGNVLAGGVPARALRLIQEWMALHADEVLANWRRARAGEPLLPIPPLA
jgi:hypothetical protein